MKNIENQIIRLILKAQNILIMPSSPPDGDSLGSAVAFYLSLRKLGKNATVVCVDPVPDVYQFLPQVENVSTEFSPNPDFIITVDTEKTAIESIHTEVQENKVNIILTPKRGNLTDEKISFAHGEHKYDLIITVDTATLKQLGKFYYDNISIYQEIPVINIDHHASNEHFGLINYVDVMSSSTTEMITGILEALEEDQQQEVIDEDIATLLLAGIITDTGSFQNANTSPRSFANSAKLIKKGARQQEIIQHIFKTKRLSTLKIWGRVLSNIRIDKPHRFLWSVITKKDLLDTNSKIEETEGIIDELMSNAPETEIILLLKEKDGDVLAGSVRTTNDAVDASQIASFFGGGGHSRAAGFKVQNATFELKGEAIIEKIKDYQSKRLNHPGEELNITPETTEMVENEAKPEDLVESKIETVETTKFQQPTSTEESAETGEQQIKKDQSTFEINPGVRYTFEE